MKTTFHPSSLQSFDGMVAHVLASGSMFVGISNDEQIYVPSGLVDGMNVMTGDGLRCWCVPNLPEHGLNAKYRAIRCLVTHRLVDTVPAPAEKAPASVASTSLTVVGASTDNAAAAPLPNTLDNERLKADIEAVLLEGSSVMNAKEIYTSICRKTPALWKDTKLQARVASALFQMADKGEVATAKLYSSTEQLASTAVYYALTVELIIMHMKGDFK